MSNTLQGLNCGAVSRLEVCTQGVELLLELAPNRSCSLFQCFTSLVSQKICGYCCLVFPKESRAHHTVGWEWPTFTDIVGDLLIVDGDVVDIPTFWCEKGGAHEVGGLEGRIHQVWLGAVFF